MPTATLTTATVEVIGKPKPSKFADKPPYRPVLFNLADGSQVWKSYSEGSPELEWLNTGETYQATIAGEEVTLIAPATAPTAPATAPQATAQAPSQAPSHQAPANARQAYMETLERVGNRYAACMAKAKQVWLTQYSEEELKALPELISSTTATLFIECSKLTR
jgi:hypothetical protein